MPTESQESSGTIPPSGSCPPVRQTAHAKQMQANASLWRKLFSLHIVRFHFSTELAFPLIQASGLLKSNYNMKISIHQQIN